MTKRTSVDDSSREARPQALGGLTGAQRAIIMLVTRKPGLSRAEIAVDLGLSPALLSKAVNGFLDAGLMMEARERPRGRGQPALRLEIAPGAVSAIGVSVSTDGVTVATSDLAGDVLSVERFAVNGADFDAAHVGLSHGIERARRHTARLAGIGIWIPALMDTQDRIVEITPSQRAIDFDGFRRRLQAEHGVPVWFSNRTYAIAEQMRRPDQDAAVYYLSLDYGVGAVLAEQGRLMLGSSGQASNIGALIPDTGPRPALPDLIQFFGLAPGSLDLDALERMAEIGDPMLARWVAERGSALSEPLSLVVQLLNPTQIVFCGAFPRTVLQGLIERVSLDRYDVPNRRPIEKPRLRVADTVGPDALAVTATQVPFYHLLRSSVG